LDSGVRLLFYVIFQFTGTHILHGKKELRLILCDMEFTNFLAFWGKEIIFGFSTFCIFFIQYVGYGFMWKLRRLVN